MYWVTIIWSMVAAACMTLAVMHLIIWIRARDGWSHLAFSCNASASAMIGGFELAMMHAATPEQFAALCRWTHVPLFVLVVSMVWFVRLYFRAGRSWLAWVVVGGRALALVLNF